MTVIFLLTICVACRRPKALVRLANKAGDNRVELSCKGEDAQHILRHAKQGMIKVGVGFRLGGEDEVTAMSADNIRALGGSENLEEFLSWLE